MSIFNSASILSSLAELAGRFGRVCLTAHFFNPKLLQSFPSILLTIQEALLYPSMHPKHI
jgi:hypothetical protein